MCVCGRAGGRDLYSYIMWGTVIKTGVKLQNNIHVRKMKSYPGFPAGPFFFWGGGGENPPQNQLLPPPTNFLLTLFLFTLSHLPLGYSPPSPLTPPQKVKSCRKPCLSLDHRKVVIHFHQLGLCKTLNVVESLQRKVYLLQKQYVRLSFIIVFFSFQPYFDLFSVPRHQAPLVVFYSTGLEI